MTIHIIQWITGILLGCCLAGYLFRWYCTAVKIDPSIPYRYLVHVESYGKKWIVINPATPWHVLEAIYVLLFRKLGRKPKKEIEASNDRRVQILRKLWTATASVLFFLGTISVSAEEFPYLFKIHTDRPEHSSKQKEPDQEKSKHNLSVPQPKQNLSAPEPKQNLSALEPKQNLSAPQPQTSSVNESANQQDPPKLRIAAETKPHKDEVHKLKERIHRINEKLNKIETQLVVIDKKLPAVVKPLHRLTKQTIVEVNKTIAEVDQIEKQIPALTNETINGVNELQKQITGILK